MTDVQPGVYASICILPALKPANGVFSWNLVCI